MTDVKPLGTDELDRLHAYWRAANYLAAGQIYLLDNPLLERPLDFGAMTRPGSKR
ncbi:MAG TPA: hypothetical protein VFO25_05830 [Candidatus Eremiobacteraceae bacterium]|nr:hypothetical protein [Candidatus Eremiobacteraceae bacterium]